ncbi:uncharacterized protein BDR25DRAFT_13997 [Lindgomyces ingoldianus]|uniref:Uncharacterized protein n=1 Tax=Lindgomyces ingoldianus TaxID=673940 RepID=A0ACB6R0N7_9PLEO|nr:uncharacterized protein BDR25DRAFT_13997 [Lindgomyces ingoldianus]KAF2472388.1 hypothetical protein BDR25DRAFT_13997 [Lindgomyces ingoldianus]
MSSPSYYQISTSDSDDETGELKLPVQPSRRPYTLPYALVFTTLSLVITNWIWYWHHFHHCIAPRTPLTPFPESLIMADSMGVPYPLSPSPSSSPYHTVAKPFNWTTPYSASNKTLTNTLWRSLFPIGQGVVYIPTTWALSQNLPTSILNSANASEAVYFIAAYHQLHCLSVIRSTLYKYKEGRVSGEEGVKWDHAIHCLDSLRQSVMCTADSTLLYTEDGIVFGDRQARTCRDWEGLREWVVAHHA